MHFLNLLIAFCALLSVLHVAGVDNREMKLLKSGEEKSCIDRNAFRFDDYCLAIATSLTSGSELKCYFNDIFVYECKADGSCEGKGILKNMAFPSADNPCTGIPLMDIYPSMMGTYICIPKDSGIQRLQLTYCKDPGLNALKLLKKGIEVSCVDRGAARHDDYCLSVDMSTVDGSEFECFFNDTSVFRSKADGTCEVEGILEKNIAFPDKNPCEGIALANILPNMMGTYKCLVKGTKTLQSLVLSYCDTHNSPDVTLSTTIPSNENSSKVQSTMTEEHGLNSLILAVGIGVPLLTIIVLLTLFLYHKFDRKGQHPLPQTEPAQTKPLVDV